MQDTCHIGFSPCPNDTFIFDALVNGKIDTEGIDFNPVIEDVETLNKWAYRGKLEVSKVSFSTLLNVLDKYSILHAGSALGKGCGPLLVAKRNIKPEEINSCRIAIPGVHTTANMLLRFAFPEARQRFSVIFSDIENAVLQDKFDLGLIIHESRFTYAEKGLIKIMDLGEYWEQQTGLPIPLAGIAVRKDVPYERQQKVDRLIKKSLEYAFDQYPALSSFTTSHAQEMEEAVMRKHIELYVNDFSLDLGNAGKSAIFRMYDLIRGEKSKMGDDCFV